jgi:hypothetical protein
MTVSLEETAGPPPGSYDRAVMERKLQAKLAEAGDDDELRDRVETRYRERLELQEAPDVADLRKRAELCCAAHGGPMGQGPEDCPICRLLDQGVWDCEICGAEVIGMKPSCAVCGKLPCKIAMDARLKRVSDRQKDRVELLRSARVPELFHAPFDLGRVQHKTQPSPESRIAGARATWPAFADSPVNRWKGEPACCLITGPTGVGKSMLAAELLTKLMRAGRTPAAWVLVGDLLDEQREISLGAAGRLIVTAREAEALVLDDLGAGYRFTGDLQFLLNLVERRVGRLKPTIYTSHVALGDLSETAGAILSRAGSGIVLELDGADQRGRRAL